MHEDMRKLKAKTIIVFSVTIFTILFIIAFFHVLRLSADGRFSPSRPNVVRTERELQSNREAFQVIVEYLLNAGFDHGSIRRDNACYEAVYIFAYGGGLRLGHVPISDEEVADAIRCLFQQGHRSITMRSDEGVKFLRWTHFEQGRGIAYLPQGRIHDGGGLLPFAIEIEPLTEDSWYFYVEWFSVWRGRRTSN